MRGCDFGAKCTRNCLAATPGPAGEAHGAAPDSLAGFRGGRDGRVKGQGKGRARGYIKGRREDGTEEKDGGKEESKGKLGCVPPETKSWLRHCEQKIASLKLLHSYFIIMGQWVTGSDPCDPSKNDDPFDP